MSDLNRRLNVLWDISKSLQTQIGKINEAMNQLIQKAENVQKTAPVQEPVTVNSSIQIQPSSHIATDKGNNNINIVPGKSTYSEAAGNMILRPNPEASAQENLPHDKDKKNSHSSKKPQKKSPNVQNERAVNTETNYEEPTAPTLFIGDSILSGVNHKGLKRNIECQSISGATVNTLLEKIKIYDLKNFQNIIIYVGGNDASQKRDMEYVEETYEQLINTIKGKNPKITIYLCNVCPCGDTNVTEVNELILRQSQVHGATYVDSNRNFYNKQKQLKSHFYKVRDNIHLSSSGTRGLLGAISKYIGIVENFKFCAYGLQHGNRPVRRNTSAAVQPTEGMHHAFSQRYQQRGEERTSPSDDRCFKCGLRNHKTYECRHKNQIQCYHCKLWGHKDSVCWDF